MDSRWSIYSQISTDMSNSSISRRPSRAQRWRLDWSVMNWFTSSDMKVLTRICYLTRGPEKVTHVWKRRSTTVQFRWWDHYQMIRRELTIRADSIHTILREPHIIPFPFLIWISLLIQEFDHGSCTCTMYIAWVNLGSDNIRRLISFVWVDPLQLPSWLTNCYFITTCKGYPGHSSPSLRYRALLYSGRAEPTGAFRLPSYSCKFASEDTSRRRKGFMRCLVSVVVRTECFTVRAAHANFPWGCVSRFKFQRLTNSEIAGFSNTLKKRDEAQKNVKHRTRTKRERCNPPRFWDALQLNTNMGINHKHLWRCTQDWSLMVESWAM